MRHDPRPRVLGLIACALVLSGLLVGCGDDTAADDASTGSDGGSDGAACWASPPYAPVDMSEVDVTSLEGTTLTLVAYDSFYLPDSVFEAFEDDTGIHVEVLTTSDTGTMVSQAILNSGSPLGDVMWGIDNTFLCRALLADVFLPYDSPMRSTVVADLDLDPHHRVTPVDYGDLCVNYRFDAMDALGLEPPASLDDLRDPAYAGTLVTENPETSAPGMGLLLSSIARYGEPGWQDFWRDLADGGVAVEPGWTEAYYGPFAPGGDRAMVMSYATSPLAELMFAEEPLDSSPTGALLDGCFRSIEFAGILAGSEHPEASALLVDFLLSPTLQGELPTSMVVYPANAEVDEPQDFADLADRLPASTTISPDRIEEGRAAWTEEWTQIVLG